ncbi:plastocyanin/azurin family copper-binding protein [Paenibacillus soyae]|uniref:Plastocyanin/azurin family copper-binding protein n=1 Tax=Paenibacillus soyae TaxID=2969249 RepID=A0A9X2S8Z6_9BACL|nr:plastocyanin/azurin family copper-binding protein [Paenibacillus soyae]MCR2804934.1 plastocyanin/azurin family copper-binding protein [Paenibacillus soyae]
MIAKKISLAFLALVLCLSVFLTLGAAAEEQNAGNVKTDAETAADLKLLLGDGNGVNETYLAKKSTRLQAAIISLRLQGLLDEAMAYKGTINFSDASLVSSSNQAVLAYLKNHPEYGWSGKGGAQFDPAAGITSQQLYKVLLEVAGFKQDKDFTYAETEKFAATKGFKQIAGTNSLTNAHIATALVESLHVHTTGGSTLFEELQTKGVIEADAALPGDRILLASSDKLGTYFTDQNGRTLYFFTKDAEDSNSCKDKCLENWPVFYAEDLQIPGPLNPDDFSVLTRTDGTKQTTYKGWPLYYFVKDMAAGDTLGEAVGGVWFVAKSDYAVMLGTSSTLGNYLTDDYGRTLYYFDKDSLRSSMPSVVCEGECLETWPAYMAEGASTISTLLASDIGSITLSDGTKQSTYKGYPLYYFVKDAKHGDALGQNVNEVWFVVDPATFTGKTAPQVKTYNIDIKQFSFGTEPLTVEAGSQIIFTNFDDMKHNAVALGGAFETPLLAKGESYTITLDEPGTYNYFCEPHKQFMTGQIIVK